MAKVTKKALKEMTAMYHEWRLLKDRVAEMEKTLKAWVSEHGPLEVSESKVWDGVEQVEESINVDAPVFNEIAPALFDDQLDLLISKSAPKKNFEVVCALLAKRQARATTEVYAQLWERMKEAGCIKTTKKTVFAERTVKL